MIEECTKSRLQELAGIAIIISMTVSLLIYYILSLFYDSLKVDMRFVGFCIGAAIIAIMGFLDDFKELRALEKLIFQIVAASVIYLCGVGILGVKIPFIYNNINKMDNVWCKRLLSPPTDASCGWYYILDRGYWMGA